MKAWNNQLKSISGAVEPNMVVKTYSKSFRYEYMQVQEPKAIETKAAASHFHRLSRPKSNRQPADPTHSNSI